MIKLWNEKHAKSDGELSEELLTQWIRYFANDAEVTKINKSIKKLHEDVFKRFKVEQIDYAADLPAKMTKEMYIQIYRKIWASIRHDLYKAIMAKQKEMRTTNLPEKVFLELYDKESANFEKVRLQVYELMMDEVDVSQETAKEIMQKAYCYFATIPSKGLGDGAEAVRSRWADLVSEAATKHSRYVNDMMQGKFYDTIEKDPRDSKAPDEKTDISSIPGAVKSQKTFLDDQRHVEPVPKGADKFIEKMKDKLHDVQARVKAENEAKQKEDEARNGDAPETKTEAPKAEEPKTEEPIEQPKAEEPKTEEPKTEEPKSEEPKTEVKEAEAPKTEEPKTEGQKTFTEEEAAKHNKADDL